MELVSRVHWLQCCRPGTSGGGLSTKEPARKRNVTLRSFGRDKDLMCCKCRNDKFPAALSLSLLPFHIYFRWYCLHHGKWYISTTTHKRMMSSNSDHTDGLQAPPNLVINTLTNPPVPTTRTGVYWYYILLATVAAHLWLWWWWKKIHTHTLLHLKVISWLLSL